MTLRHQHNEVAMKVKRIMHNHPFHQVLIRMAGVGVRTAGRLVTEVAASTSHLSAHVGLVPVTQL